jgi:hypothetical protein
MDEATIIKKYSKLNIVKGSLKKGRGTNKNQVVVKAPCGHQIKRYTSDLWHLRNCPVCGAEINQSPKRAPKAATKRAK